MRKEYMHRNKDLCTDRLKVRFHSELPESEKAIPFSDLWNHSSPLLCHFASLGNSRTTEKRPRTSGISPTQKLLLNPKFTPFSAIWSFSVPFIPRSGFQIYRDRGIGISSLAPLREVNHEDCYHRGQYRRDGLRPESSEKRTPRFNTGAKIVQCFWRIRNDPRCQHLPESSGIGRFDIRPYPRNRAVPRPRPEPQLSFPTAPAGLPGN